MIFNTSESSASGSLPKGVIVLWSGATNAIPDGWHICDGSNGTPNLSGKFVLGTGNGYNIGSTGGEAYHTLTINEMPYHSHRLPMTVAPNMGSYKYVDWGTGTTDNPTGGVETRSVGGSAPHNNMPPYYVLAYIMKL